MDNQNFKEKLKNNRFWISIAVLGLIIVGGFWCSFAQIARIDEDLKILSENLSSTTVTLYKTAGLFSETIAGAKQEIAAAQSNINAVQSQVGGVEQTVGSISGAVSTLQKLTTTDPELLKKYSKVYFLNENYTPAHLTILPQEYVYSNTKQEQFLTEAWLFLQKLLMAAKASNIELYVKSAFRSFAEQQTLKSEYKVVFGAGTANSFSADQGYSEHQLGTAVDLITGGFGGELVDSFDATAAFTWLRQNAYKFGFELSYPKNNTYYTYEPWHWRFVGVKLATYLHDQNKNFYDMDQRDIDAYLASLFD